MYQDSKFGTSVVCVLPLTKITSLTFSRGLLGKSQARWHSRNQIRLESLS